MTDYSPPELNTERRICGRIRAQVLRDPCGHCAHRQTVFGKAICSGAIGRNFWTCTRDQREPTFKLDEATLTKVGT
jgi:hypothetical protein